MTLMRAAHYQSSRRRRFLAAADGAPREHKQMGRRAMSHRETSLAIVRWHPIFPGSTFRLTTESSRGIEMSSAQGSAGAPAGAEADACRLDSSSRTGC
jgi:hypothetical protein